MATFHDITTDQLRQMIHLKERIEYLQGLLSTLRGKGSPATVTKKKVARSKGKRPMSPEHRAKLVAAQKARWAKVQRK